MSASAIEKQVDIEAASAASQTELIEILKQFELINGATFHKYLFDAVVKAINISNLETAKQIAIIYEQTQDHNFESEVKINYEKTLEANEDFSWVSFINSVVTNKRHHYESDATELIKALSKQNLIRLIDFVQRPISTFNLILTCIDDPDQISETIYTIILYNKLKRSDRMHMLRTMKKSGKLTLQPCGPEKLAPHFYCVALKRHYLLKLFADIPGMAQYRGPIGENFLAFAAERHPFLKYVKLFTKDELKSMLVEKHSNQYVLDLLRNLNFHARYLPSEFLNAFKELLMEGKLHDSQEVDAPRLTNAHFIYKWSGIIRSYYTYEDALKNYRTLDKAIECDGQTTFAFEELPLEILQLICKELDSRAFIALSLTSKSLRKFSERFDSRYFEQLMKKEFPMIYELKSTDQSAIDWRSQLNLHSRRAHNWRTCKDPNQIRIDAPDLKDIFSFDENWLIGTTQNNRQTLLWNAKEQKTYHKIHESYPAYKYHLAVLDSPELDFPTIVSLTSSRIYIINYNTPEVTIDEFTKVWDGSYVAPVSRTRIISGTVPELFDVELQQTVVKNENISRIQNAAHNKTNQMTAMYSIVNYNRLAKTNIYVLDKNFEITHSIQQEEHEYYHGEITWLDEFRFSLRDRDLKIADIRMPRDFVEIHELNNYKPITISDDYKMLSYLGDFTTDHVLNVKVPKDHINLGYVWSLKDFTWSNVVVLPDDVEGDPKCNSRYAAFKTKSNSICLLDFAASK